MEIWWVPPGILKLECKLKPIKTHRDESWRVIKSKTRTSCTSGPSLCPTWLNFPFQNASLLQASLWSCNKLLLYIIISQHPSDSQPFWIITLEDPAAVLQFFRTTLDGSHYNLAHLFLHNVIPFNTFFHSPQMTHSNALHGKAAYAVHIVTQLLFQHKANTTDYSQYEEICN